MVFLHVTARMQRGKLQESADNYEKYLLPIFNKYGQKLVGAFKTTIGIYDEVTNIYGFENMGEMERIRRAIGQDPDWIQYQKKPKVIEFEQSKLMVGFPFSPLK